jgi:hypothetical protein
MSIRRSGYTFAELMRSDDAVSVGVILLAVVLFVTVKGGIGYLIGRGKGKGGLGFVLGLFLGFIGWIIIAVIPGESQVNFQIQKRRCKRCRRVIPKGAVGCRDCRPGAAMPAPNVVSADGRVGCPWCAERIMPKIA